MGGVRFISDSLYGGFWGFLVGGDDCWLRFVSISLFFISILSFQFSLHFYDKINEKRRGLYCVGEGLFRFDFRWWLLDCVIIDISIPGFGCVDFFISSLVGAVLLSVFLWDSLIYLFFWYGTFVVFF